MIGFIRHIHSSSRFDRTPASLAKAAKRYAKQGDLMTYTEVEAEPREESLRALSRLGFGTVTGDKSYANDCAIQFRLSKLRMIEHGNEPVTTSRYTNVKGLSRDPAYATWGVFEDLDTGNVVVVVVAHLASSIEGNLRLGQRTARVVSFLTGFRGMKRIGKRLRKQHSADATMLVADFNLNFKLEWVRRLIKTLAPSYRHTWRVLPKGGTHGSRVIDATLLKGRLWVRGSAVLMKDDPSSDHRPYRERLFWLARRPRP